MDSVAKIREDFLYYFKKNGHKIVSSSPLVPHNDPTLMFVNSGMVQFKNVFTGLETRDYQSAVTAQKCVRAGGKHNDLENVGYTARHHTFFEMLGNFSFGGYFKEQAISHAWGLLTRDFGLDPKKLLVTVYHEDEEAATLWRKIAGLGDDRIIRIATSDNFWSMGDKGPCGPCSEIFYDHGPAIAGGPPGSPDEDGDRFVEIWNLVFMQYEQGETERLNLPRPSIDTGMGLERIAAVLQGKHDNYDIDLMRTLIEASANITHTEPDGPANISHRVIADHLRSAGFLIADGVLPSNEGRGYVLRRIMRRAMRHLHQLGCDTPVMFELVPTLVDEMGWHYTELLRAQPLISETLRLEETRFKETLARGLRILTDAVGEQNAGGTLDGKTAFKLYDTFGFPLDLTEDFLRGYGWSVDMDGFQSAMKAQKTAARAAWVGSGAKADERLLLAAADRLGATEFLGYTSLSNEGVVLGLFPDSSESPESSSKPNSEISTAKTGEVVMIAVNQTCFYGESGGQVGDTGRIEWEGGGRADIANTTKTAGLVLHHATIISGELSVGQQVVLSVDSDRRARLRANHSATHLLHEALRQVLGDHVAQKGSLVAPDRLRFDFSHAKAVTDAELQQVQDIVNARIRLNSDITTRIMTPEAAITEGAIALFGEKYGDEVRVVMMGGASDSADRTCWSVELCGGTHAARTGDIAIFKIISESAVAGGVRRIEAATHQGAEAWFSVRDGYLSQSAKLLKAPADQVPTRITQLLEERRKLERELGQMRQKLATGGGNSGSDGGGAAAETIGDVQFIGKVLEDTPARDLKSMADAFRADKQKLVICLVARFEGKASAVIAASPDLAGEVDAVALVRIAAEALGGKGGGGRADMAQAGGPNANAAQDAVDKVRAALSE